MKYCRQYIAGSIPISILKIRFVCIPVPVEKHIDITDAMLSWCDEWRHFYDENNKKEEAQKLHARIRKIFKLDFSLANARVCTIKNQALRIQHKNVKKSLCHRKTEKPILANLHIFQKCVGEHSFVARFELKNLSKNPFHNHFSYFPHILNEKYLIVRSCTISSTESAI